MSWYCGPYIPLQNVMLSGKPAPPEYDILYTNREKGIMSYLSMVRKEDFDWKYHDMIAVKWRHTGDVEWRDFDGNMVRMQPLWYNSWMSELSTRALGRNNRREIYQL